MGHICSTGHGRVKRVFNLLKEVKYYVTEGFILLFYNRLIVTPYNCETGPSKLWISHYMCCQLSLISHSHNWQNQLSDFQCCADVKEADLASKQRILRNCISL